MDGYSTTLLVGMISAGVAGSGIVWTRLQVDAPREKRIAIVAAGLSVILAAFSIIYHWAFGHRPASAEALSAFGFLQAHPAPVFTLLLGAGFLWLARRHRAARTPTR